MMAGAVVRVMARLIGVGNARKAGKDQRAECGGRDQDGIVLALHDLSPSQIERARDGPRNLRGDAAHRCFIPPPGRFRACRPAVASRDIGEAGPACLEARWRIRGETCLPSPAAASHRSRSWYRTISMRGWLGVCWRLKSTRETKHGPRRSEERR